MLWLVCPDLVRRISELEAAGLVQAFDDRLRHDEQQAARHRLRQAHQSYVAARWRLLSDEHRSYIEQQGWRQTFEEGGIGGITDWTTVKCLHVHYADWLATKTHADDADDAIAADDDGGGSGGSGGGCNNVIGEWTHGALQLRGSRVDNG